MTETSGKIITIPSPHKLDLKQSAYRGDYLVGIKSNSKGCFAFMMSNGEWSHEIQETSYNLITRHTRKVEIFYNKDYIRGFAVYDKNNEHWMIGESGL